MSVTGTRRRGFTLVELMIVVAIVGVLAALAIYGVRKYVASAKTTEARNALGRIGKDAVAALDAPHGPGDVLEFGHGAADSHLICPTAAPIPDNVGAIKGQKYQSSPNEWADDPGWGCLRFTMKDPQYFQYEYVLTGSPGAFTGFTAYARGDLNGDGTTSEFYLIGKGISVPGAGVHVILAPNIVENHPEE